MRKSKIDEGKKRFISVVSATSKSTTEIIDGWVNSRNKVLSYHFNV